MTYEESHKASLESLEGKTEEERKQRIENEDVYNEQLVGAIGRARRVALLADQFSVFRLCGYLKRRVQTVYDFAENSWVNLRSTCKI
jgi:hypothetical protein